MTYATVQKALETLGKFKDEGMTDKKGGSLKLSTGGRQVLKVEKNGTELTSVASSPSSGEYTFVPDSTILLGDDAVATDIFVIRSSEYSEDVIEELINQGESEINGELKGLEMTIPYTGSSPQLESLTINRVHKKILQQDVGEDEGKTTTIENLNEEFEKYIEKVKDGKKDILDDSGDSLTGDKQKFGSFDWEQPDGTFRDEYEDY